MDEKHGFFSMKKILAFLCALVFLLGFAAAGAGEAEPVTLTVALIWPDEAGAYHAPALKTLDEFEAAFPGIRLEVEWYDTDEWKDYGEVLALSDDLPDVFYWNAGGALAFRGKHTRAVVPGHGKHFQITGTRREQRFRRVKGNGTRVSPGSGSCP